MLGKELENHSCNLGNQAIMISFIGSLPAEINVNLLVYLLKSSYHNFNKLYPIYLNYKKHNVFHDETAKLEK